MDRDAGDAERQALLARLLEAVKRCQVRFGGIARRSELATDDDGAVVEVCLAFEEAFAHGIKSQHATSAPSLTVRHVTDLVTRRASNNVATQPSFWHLVKQFLSRQELERFYLLKGVTTDVGRGRAWLRASLNEHSLEKYVQAMLSSRSVLEQIYSPWAFLLDEERSSILPSMAAGLNILFALKVDNVELNLAPATVRSPCISDRELIARPESERDQAEALKPRKKKKAKAPAQIISFHEEDIHAEPFRATSTPAAVISSAPPTSVATGTKFEFSPKNHQESLEKQILLLETAKRAGAARRRADGAKENHDAAQFDYQPVQLGHAKNSSEAPSDDKEDSLEHIYSRSPSDSQSFVSQDLSERGSGRAKLTPVKNCGVGALIPLNLSLAEDLQSEDSMSIRSYGEESDYSYSTPASTLEHCAARGQEQHCGNAAAGARGSVANGEEFTSTLSREDLKQALLSVMERKDEIQKQCDGLKRLLEKEVAAVERLKEQLGDVRRKTQEQSEKQETRILTLSRENELLKHQLKKYIGAVQKLRDGPQAYETLAQLERKSSESDPNQRYVDYHFEASEYEKKLIQVADMHSELLEFNNQLLRTIQAKETLVQRMREELIDVRGPLPQDDADEDACSGVSGGDRHAGAEDSASLLSYSVMPAARLLHIWIPSVFLSGTGSRTHHVYQVYLRIKDEEWNIYRRYSDFYALHRDLRSKEAIVATFDFPPKKSVGNKAEKVVEDRRKRLQGYLRRIINLLIQMNPSLSAKPDKAGVILLLPFFGENSRATRSHSRSQSRSRSLFSRGRAASTTSSAQLAL